MLQGLEPTGELSCTCRGFTDDSYIASFASQILVINPTIRFFETCPQRRLGLPTKIFLDQSVIAVPAIHALGRAKIVISLQLDSGNFLRHIRQLIDRYRLTRS